MQDKYYFSDPKGSEYVVDGHEAKSNKKIYFKPELVDYGLVGNLTQAGSKGGREASMMGILMGVMGMG